MKITIIIIIIFHGIIHLLGFLKAFHFAQINQLSSNITKPLGIIWLIAFIIFTLTLFQFILKSELWWLTAFLAIIISQTLIIISWHDAKFGTIPNLIILIVAIIAYGNWNFNRTTSYEITNLFSRNIKVVNSHITQNDITKLPPPVQKWLSSTGIIGKDKISFVRLKQKTMMKLKPEQKDWSEGTAFQYYTIQNPAFIWEVNMKMKTFIDIVGRDSFINGKGKMLIKLFSLINVVNEDGYKIDTGALQRFLGEIVWFPSAALSPYIKWETIDSLSARATMSYQGTEGSGIFYFNKIGDFVKFSALRYMGNEENSERKEWIVTANKIQEVNGVRIPIKMEATWKLNSYSWTWLKLEIEDIQYNVPGKY